ncbi:UMP-CMP kinase-like protein [Aureobasidium pullulans]|uniref:Uridylate kinase n=1 Tax=Aureobasidium pullulans TaxID=5580 RepID=A0A4S9KYQ4_AURPU|nr:UMP-CMP kinase-like protein [Aureobasidium pullulans]
MNSLAKSLPRIPASRRSFTTSIRRLAQEPAPVDPQAAKETKVSANYSNPQIRKPRRGPYADSPLPVFPLLAIFFTGSFLFYQLSKSRQGQGKSHYPLFPTGVADGEATVIFVLGGPGAGKGTQCSNIVRDYKFKHLSAGDLLREEQDRQGSDFGDLIKEYIRDGKIVPMEVTIQLLENAMQATIKNEGINKFLIDGFPRKMDQAVQFEKSVCKSVFTLFFECPEHVMEERLINRGKTSGRADDNEESIRKRFRTFVETSMPVVEYFDKDGRVVKVQAVQTPDEVYEHVKVGFTQRGIKLV